MLSPKTVDIKYIRIENKVHSKISKNSHFCSFRSSCLNFNSVFKLFIFSLLSFLLSVSDFKSMSGSGGGMRPLNVDDFIPKKKIIKKVIPILKYLLTIRHPSSSFLSLQLRIIRFFFNYGIHKSQWHNLTLFLLQSLPLASIS